MVWIDWFKAALALCIWREARGESYDGKRAVAHVIANRVAASKLPDQWGDVIERKWQFSSMTAPGDSQLVLWPKQPDTAFEECMDIAEHVFADSDFDLTLGATHYFANSIEMPEWAKTMTETLRLGHHTFYKK